MSEKKISDEDAQKIKKLEKQVTQSRRSLEELPARKAFSEKVLEYLLPAFFYLYNESGDILRWNKNHDPYRIFLGRASTPKDFGMVRWGRQGTYRREDT